MEAETVVAEPAVTEEVEPELFRHKGLDHERKLHEAVRLILEALLDEHDHREEQAERKAESDELALRRLATTLEDNQRLRGKLSLAEDTIRALRQETENRRRREFELQERIRQLEEALQNPVPDARAFRELDRTMRQAPTVRG